MLDHDDLEFAADNAAAPRVMAAPAELQRLMDFLHTSIEALVFQEPAFEYQIWACGGAVLHELDPSFGVNDYDIFTTHPKELIQFLMYSPRVMHSHKGIRAENFIIFGHKVQVIDIEGFTSYNDVFNTFDMSICQVGYDGTEFISTQQFEQDFQCKTNRLVSVTNPLHTLQRAIKYAARGYPLVDSAVIALANAIKDYPGDFNDPDHNLIEYYANGKRRAMNG